MNTRDLFKYKKLYNTEFKEYIQHAHTSISTGAMHIVVANKSKDMRNWKLANGVYPVYNTLVGHHLENDFQILQQSTQHIKAQLLENNSSSLACIGLVQINDSDWVQSQLCSFFNHFNAHTAFINFLIVALSYQPIDSSPELAVSAGWSALVQMSFHFQTARR